MCARRNRASAFFSWIECKVFILTEMFALVHASTATNFASAVCSHTTSHVTCIEDCLTIQNLTQCCILSSGENCNRTSLQAENFFLQGYDKWQYLLLILNHGAMPMSCDSLKFQLSETQINTGNFEKLRHPRIKGIFTTHLDRCQVTIGSLSNTQVSSLSTADSGLTTGNIHYMYVTPSYGILTVSVNENQISPHRTKRIVNYTYDLAFESKSLKKYAGSPVTNISHECVSKALYKNDWTNEHCKISEVGTKINCVCTDGRFFHVRQVLSIYVLSLALRLCKVVIPILIVMSLVVLGFCLALLILFRKHDKSGRAFVEISIVIAFCVEGINCLIGHGIHEIEILPQWICITVAVLDLYLMFTMSLWLINEGVLLFMKIGLAGYIRPNYLSRKKVLLITLFSWLLPALVIGCTSAFDVYNESLLTMAPLYEYIQKKNFALGEYDYKSVHDISQYTKFHTCWTYRSGTAYYLCLTSIALAFIINISVSVYVLRVLWEKSKKVGNCQMPKNEKDIHILTAKAVISLTCSLGLVHFIAFMVAVFSGDLIASIHVRNFLIIFEGPIVFYFYLWRNKDVMDAFKRFRKRRHAVTI